MLTRIRPGSRCAEATGEGPCIDVRCSSDRACGPWDLRLSVKRHTLAEQARQGEGLLIRHAITEPGLGDPPGFTLGQCSSQRKLSEAGQADRRLACHGRGVSGRRTRLTTGPWLAKTQAAWHPKDAHFLSRSIKFSYNSNLATDCQACPQLWARMLGITPGSWRWHDKAAATPVSAT